MTDFKSEMAIKKLLGVARSIRFIKQRLQLELDSVEPDATKVDGYRNAGISMEFARDFIAASLKTGE